MLVVLVGVSCELVTMMIAVVVMRDGGCGGGCSCVVVVVVVVVKASYDKLTCFFYELINYLDGVAHLVANPL